MFGVGCHWSRFAHLPCVSTALTCWKAVDLLKSWLVCSDLSVLIIRSPNSWKGPKQSQKNLISDINFTKLPEMSCRMCMQQLTKYLKSQWLKEVYSAPRNPFWLIVTLTPERERKREGVIDGHAIHVRGRRRSIGAKLIPLSSSSCIGSREISCDTSAESIFWEIGTVYLKCSLTQFSLENTINRFQS